MINFAYPHLLWGLFALLIPILVHLFTFRRYKTIYFSKTANLLNLVEKRKHRRELKHWLILLTRLLGLASMILAFAQPFRTDTTTPSSSRNRAAIFLDNSYSLDVPMGSIRSFEESKKRALSLIDAYPSSTRFQIASRNLSAEERRFTDAATARQLVRSLALSLAPTNDREVFTFLRETSRDQETDFYWIGDLQALPDAASIPYPELKTPIHVWPVQTPLSENLSLDTVYSGARKALDDSTFQSALHVRISALSRTSSTQTTVQLSLNGRIASQQDVTLEPGRDKWIEMPFQAPYNTAFKGEIYLDDAGFDFDDYLFFASKGYRTPTVLILGEPATALATALEAGGLKFQQKSLYSLDYGELSNYDAVFINESNEVPSGLIGSLQRFNELGKPIVIIPGNDINTASFESLCNAFQLPKFRTETAKTSGQIDRISNENPFFGGVFEELPEQSAWPNLGSAYPLEIGSSVRGKGLMFARSGEPLVWLNDALAAPVYLFSSAWSNGDVFSHGIFPALMYQLCHFQPNEPELFHFVKAGSAVSWNRKSAGEKPLSLHGFGNSYFPEQRIEFGRTVMELPYFWLQPGIYNVVDGADTLGPLAVNVARHEQSMNFNSIEEFERRIEPTKTVAFEPSSARLAQGLDALDATTKPLWWWLVGIAGISLLLEMLIAKYYKP